MLAAKTLLCFFLGGEKCWKKIPQNVKSSIANVRRDKRVLPGGWQRPQKEGVPLRRRRIRDYLETEEMLREKRARVNERVGHLSVRT